MAADRRSDAHLVAGRRLNFSQPINCRRSQRTGSCMKPAYFLLLTTTVALAAESKPRPEFQYQTEGIQVRQATADEPKVKAFGPDSIKAAAKYLDDGALCW